MTSEQYDLCGYCILKGDSETCALTPCAVKNSWYVTKNLSSPANTLNEKLLKHKDHFTRIIDECNIKGVSKTTAYWELGVAIKQAEEGGTYWQQAELLTLNQILGYRTLVSCLRNI